MSTKPHYPSYDVMKQKEHWDGHTRAIVASRLTREHGYLWLTLEEAEFLRAWCAMLVDDHRGEIIQYVLCHVDEVLDRNAGEGERWIGVPDIQYLIRQGIQDIDELAVSLMGNRFWHIEEYKQRQLMLWLGHNEGQQSDLRISVPAGAFFNKVLALTIEAYFSYPEVWSEIGYGGPAYPRGYEHMQIGRIDAWEAKTER